MSEYLPPKAPEDRQAELYLALSVAVASVHDVEKDGWNDFHKYAYTTAEAMLDAGRTALSRAGLALLPTAMSIRAPGTDEDFADPKKTGARLRCSPRLVRHFVLVHKAGGLIPIGPVEWPVVHEKGKDEQKSMGQALTMSLSYAIRDVLQIPRVAPDDNMDTSTQPPEEGPAVDYGAMMMSGLLAANQAHNANQLKARWEEHAPNLPGPKRQQLGSFVKAVKAWLAGGNPLASDGGLKDGDIIRASDAAGMLRGWGAAVCWDVEPVAPSAPEVPPEAVEPEGEQTEAKPDSTALAALLGLLDAKTVGDVETLEAAAFGADLTEAEFAMVHAYAVARSNILTKATAEDSMGDEELAAYEAAKDVLEGYHDPA